MAEYEKFKFDNFIIKDGDDLPEFPEELPIPTTDTALSVPAEADNTEQTLEAEIGTEPEVEEHEEIELPKEEEEELPQLPEVITFTEEEVEEKIKEAEDKAYEKGRQEGLREQGAELNLLLEQIDKALQNKMAGAEKIKEELSNQFKNFAKVLIEKLVPTMAAEQAEARLKMFLEENFSNFKNEAKLSFYFNPDIITKAQEIVARLAHKTDYEGKIALHKDAKLGLSDCRVEWENGGVDVSLKQMQQEAEALLEEKNIKKEEGENA